MVRFLLRVKITERDLRDGVFPPEGRDNSIAVAHNTLHPRESSADILLKLGVINLQ